MSLIGKWAVIDLETTGVQPGEDHIIDVGFLAFEGTKLVNKYSSLVNSEIPLSGFIQKLTGITPKLIQAAPSWKKVKIEVQSLAEYKLLAHNAAFEQGFLTSTFDAIGAKPLFQDSLLFLAFFSQDRASLSLENIIIDLKLADKEEHRGLSDSIDLLKVILMKTYLSYDEPALRQYLLQSFQVFTSEEFWFKDFFALEKAELIEIATQIDFDLAGHVEKFKTDKKEKEVEPLKNHSWDFNSDNIQSIFKSENEIKTILPQYKARNGQSQLALRVGQAFKNGIHSLIQAPTGTGKTLGYLIPSLLFSKKNQERVLISTGTKTLQNQAMDKDVPSAMKILGLTPKDIRVVRMIGSSNHFCELLYRNENQGISWLDNFNLKYAKTFFDYIFFQNSQGKKDITKEEFPMILARLIPEFRQFLTEYQTDYRSCSGQLCTFKNECSYFNGLKAAKEANVIVANHAMTFFWPQSIERPSFIVMDEAHRVESEATKAFTLTLVQKDLEGLGRNLVTQTGSFFYLLGQAGKDEKIVEIRGLLNDAQKIIDEHTTSLKNLMQASFLKNPSYSPIYWNEKPMVRKDASMDQVSTAILNHMESLSFIVGNVFDKLFQESATYLEKNSEDTHFVTAKTSFQKFLVQLEDAKKVFELLLQQDADWSRSMKLHEDEGYLFEVAPINVGKWVHDKLLQSSASVVFTSATLSNCKGTSGVQGLEWITGYSYLDTQKRFKTGLFLEPIFDYAHNAKVFLCSDLPGINDPSYVQSMLYPFIELMREQDGRALILFSSKARFEKALEILFKEFEGKLPLFVQGIGHNVVEEFKKSKAGILVGMEAFSEGIDIPGQTLQLVLIDKVPDIRMDQVINLRRDFYEKSFGNEFVDYFLSHRTQHLQQKLGRLIRSETDKGVIVVFDPRLKSWKRNTLKSFEELMDPYQIKFVSTDEAVNEAKEFLQAQNQNMPL